jgi:cobalamin biosynthesis protein CobT
VIKNSAENIFDERAIDAFNNGLHRTDFVEELGRVRPKTMGELMDLANTWASGEDAASNKRARSPEEEQARRGNDRSRRSRNYDDYDKPKQVSAGFTSKGDRRDDDMRDSDRSGGYRNNNQDESGSGRQMFRTRPQIQQQYDQTEEQMLNGPCAMHGYFNSDGRR